MSQPSTADNTLTSEEHDQEVEEYIWNLMGRAGLLSELKSQIAQFVQNNGKTKEKFPVSSGVSYVDVSRVQPAVLSMIYEYLKWVGMKNTCALLICESPVKFDTSFNIESTNGSSESVPELCTYLSEKTARSERSFLNGHGEIKSLLGSSSVFAKTPNSSTNGPLSSQAAAGGNQTFLISGSGEPPQGSQVNNTTGASNNNNNKHGTTTTPPAFTHLALSNNSVHNSSSDNNLEIYNNNNGTSAPSSIPPPSKIPTPTSASGSAGNSVHSSSCASEANSESECTPTNGKLDPKKVYTAQYEKTVSDSLKKNLKNDNNNSKELKPSTSDQSLQQKSRERLEFSFMTEKQKLEAFDKKFNGSELFSKSKSGLDDQLMESFTGGPADKKVSNSHQGDKGGNEMNSLKNSGSFEPDLDESISDLHDSTADDVTQDLSIDSDSKVLAANAAECDHVLKLK